MFWLAQAKCGRAPSSLMILRVTWRAMAHAPPIVSMVLDLLFELYTLLLELESCILELLVPRP